MKSFKEIFGFGLHLKEHVDVRELGFKVGIFKLFLSEARTLEISPYLLKQYGIYTSNSYFKDSSISHLEKIYYSFKEDMLHFTHLNVISVIKNTLPAISGMFPNTSVKGTKINLDSIEEIRLAHHSISSHIKSITEDMDYDITGFSKAEIFEKIFILINEYELKPSPDEIQYSHIIELTTLLVDLIIAQLFKNHLDSNDHSDKRIVAELFELVRTTDFSQFVKAVQWKAKYIKTIININEEINNIGKLDKTVILNIKSLSDLYNIVPRCICENERVYERSNSIADVDKLLIVVLILSVESK